jgi:hypothetical protein
MCTRFVDERSAVMSSEDFLVGYEKAVALNTDHASLLRISDKPTSHNVSKYISRL